MRLKSIIMCLLCATLFAVFPITVHAQMSKIGCLEVLKDPASSVEVRAACLKFLNHPPSGTSRASTQELKDFNDLIVRERTALERERASIRKDREQIKKEMDAFRKEMGAFNAERATEMPR